MGKKDQTTVNLNELAQKVKEDLAPIYGLKNILSAGLILFGRLSADQQKRAIAESNGLEPMPPEVDPVQRIGEMLAEFRNHALSAQSAAQKKASRKGVKKVEGQ